MHRAPFFTKETDESANQPKDLQNILDGLDDEKEANVKFPKRLRYRGKGKALATIYKGGHPRQLYNVYWRVRVNGKPPG